MSRVIPALPIDGDSSDKRNCTVLALSAAAGIPYRDASAIAELAGRKKGESFNSAHLMEVAGKLGLSITRVDNGPTSLAKVMTQYSHGRFYARKSGHAFAIVDGKLRNYGPMGKNTRVLAVWRIS